MGHAGTLDPFATGLLIVLLGDATKHQDSYMKQDKEYEASLKLGYTSTTGDPEGEITKMDCRKTPTDNEIARTIDSFTGEISQIPPIHSAIKVDGKRAYSLARKGIEVKLEPEGTGYSVSVSLPPGVPGEFEWRGARRSLAPGVNRFRV